MENEIMNVQTIGYLDTTEKKKPTDYAGWVSL